MLAILLAVSLAAASPLLDPLSPAARQQFDAAVRAEASGSWRRASAGYGLVLQRDPGFAPAALGLGRARLALGDRAGAEAAYGRLPAEAEAVEALANLVEDGEPERAAGLYRRLTTLRLGEPGPHADLARVSARFDPAAAADAVRTWAALEDGDLDGATLLSVARSLRDAGREDAAIAMLEQCLARAPESSHAECRGRLDRIAVEQAARLVAAGGDQALNPAQRDALDRARRRAASGDLDDARAMLFGVVQQAPRSAEARAAMGDVLAALGEIGPAERAYGWAVALAPDEGAWHARLGVLLADAYGGRRHAEAAESLQRALTLRPDLAEAQLRLGYVYQGLGEWSLAARAHRAALAADPDGATGASAQAALDALSREPPPPQVLPVAAPISADVSDEAIAGYRVARVYLDRGELDKAGAELLPVLKRAPGWPPALNLQAALARRRGDPDGAAHAWSASLAAQPDQPQVRLALGELRMANGDVAAAEELWRAAAAGGAGEAHYALADLAWSRRHLVDPRPLYAVSDELDAYFETTSGGLSHAPALALQARVQRRLSLLHAGGSAALGLGLFGLLGLLWRRRSRCTLEQLVEIAPEVAHELARVLSAIRHEVLKHNTTLLDEVAAAVENGDHHAVAYAAERLFGEAGSGDGGVLARFEGYLSAISRLGLRHGVRLDLRRKDPVMAPLYGALRELRGLRSQLERPGRATAGLAEQLRDLSQRLNQDAYRAVGVLIRRMGALTVDEALIRDVDERVREEPRVAALSLAHGLGFEICEPPPPARVFRGDLEDILANLLRNAYLAGGAGGRVAVEVDEEDDPITGLESVILRVLDDAPGDLDDARLRGREIGRGLGLVVDLITRHDGSVSVERLRSDLDAGWAKAVVVRLPRADPDAAA